MKNQLSLFNLKLLDQNSLSAIVYYILITYLIIENQ